ncbi:MAG: DUF4783 domain-containing protein [Bacteroidales bacterium]|nr:DUF4783 domain-containing protein [Bacteroidales bacterium]
MKKFILLLFICLLNTQLNANPTEKISKAIGNGDVETLAAFFDENIDLKILDKENIYSKMQTKLILRDFFTNYASVNFTIHHDGGSDQAKFTIGTLETNKGTFRVYFLLKKKGEISYIQKLRIENDGQ